MKNIYINMIKNDDINKLYNRLKKDNKTFKFLFKRIVRKITN